MKVEKYIVNAKEFSEKWYWQTGCFHWRSMCNEIEVKIKFNYKFVVGIVCVCVCVFEYPICNVNDWFKKLFTIKFTFYFVSREIERDRK